MKIFKFVLNKNKMNKILTSVFILVLLLSACKDSSKKAEVAENTTSPTTDTTKKVEPKVVDTLSNRIGYSPETTSDSTAQFLSKYITEKYLKPNDLQAIDTKDRKFSFYEIDLNGDKKNEYFIKFEGNYFRGSGGGTFLLLSDDMKLINTFTVTNEPIFRSSEKINGWNDLILFGDRSEAEGVKNFIHLKYDKAKGKYPSNPSLIKKIDLAPSGHDFVMWHKDFSVAKVFEF
jgi:hypothetical protein